MSAQYLMRRWRSRIGPPRVDVPLLIALLLLIGAGLVVLFSAAGDNERLVVSQAIRMFVGLLALWVISRIPPSQLRLWTPWLFALSLLLLGAWFYSGHSFMKSYGTVVFFSLAGIAHGYAYGESIVGAEPTPMIAYLAGFTLVQLAVMFAASAAARYLDRTKPEFRGAHALGGIMSIAGVAFLALAFG